MTKPFRFEGKELEINYESSAAGELRFELEDASGMALPGFELENCLPVFGNEIERVVEWANGADVSSLTGRTVRMRVALRDADLYSFRFR